MQIRSFVTRIAAVAAVAAAGATIAISQASGGTIRAPGSSGPCAAVKVRAIPKLNTAMTRETIRSKVTSCSSATETVTLVQRIGASDVARVTSGGADARTWTITLAPGKTAVKVRYVPYACCGSYVVTDRVYSASSRQLGKSSAVFTFA